MGFFVLFGHELLGVVIVNHDEFSKAGAACRNQPRHKTKADAL